MSRRKERRPSRRLVKTFKEVRVGQIVLSGILSVMGGRGQWPVA